MKFIIYLNSLIFPLLYSNNNCLVNQRYLITDKKSKPRASRFGVSLQKLQFLLIACPLEIFSFLTRAIIF